MRLIVRMLFRLIVVLILPAIFLSGCKSDQEIQTEKNKAFLTQTTNADWSKEIPLDNLVTAAQVCKSDNYKTECGDVAYQLEDISTSYYSCKSDQRSKLCQAVIKLIGQHEILTILPMIKAVSLPDNPWYRNMPTFLLYSLSWTYGYRTEATGWWLAKWIFEIKITLACIALFLVPYFIWVWWDDRKTKRENDARTAKLRHSQHRENALKLHADMLEKQDHPANANHEQLEAKPMIIDEQAKQQSERKSELQANQAAELKAKQQEHAAAQAKLETEQAETKAILKIAFPHKNKSTPRKQVASNGLD